MNQLLRSAAVALGLIAVCACANTLFGQVISSVKSGAWNDTSVWSTQTIPTLVDDVVISSGDTVFLPNSESVFICHDLYVADSALFLPGKGNLTLFGGLNVDGGWLDTDRKGQQIFKGQVFVDREAFWLTPLSDSLSLIFEGGFYHRGDSMVIRSCLMRGRDQVIDGRSTIYVDGTLWIASGIEVANNNPVGIQFRGQGPRGVDSTAKLINNRVMEFRGPGTPMEPGILDASTPGNRVYYEGYRAQGLKGGVYQWLEVLRDSAWLELPRTMSGPVTVLNRLTVDGRTALYLSDYALTVSGEARIEGIIYSDSELASATFGEITLTGANIVGEAGHTYPVTFTQPVFFDGKNTELVNVQAVFQDTFFIAENRTFLFSGQDGAYTFAYVGIQDDGRFFARSNGADFTFTTKVEVDGQFQLSDNQIYTFQDSLIFRDSGSLKGMGGAAIAVFEGAVHNDGFFPALDGLFVFRGSISGANPVYIAGQGIIGSGATVYNRSAGGLIVVGTLDGEDASATLINEGKLIYAPSNGIPPLMPTGTLDVCSVPGNEIVFASGNKNQPVPGGCYQNLGLEGNVKLISGGDVEVFGNLTASATITKDPAALEVPKVRLTGSAEQYVYGNGSGLIETLEVDKAAGSVHLMDDVGVLGLMIMRQGIVRADSALLGLGGAARLMETPGSYVLGRVGTRRTINAGGSREFGGMGLRIRASGVQAPGETLVIRTTGQSPLPGQIERSFQIIPTNNANLDARVEFLYMDHELNGAVENDLYLEHQAPGEDFTFLDATDLKADTNMLIASNFTSFGILTARPTSLAINAFPSPMTGDFLAVDYVMDAEGEATVTIFDRAGRAFYREQVMAQAGKNQIRFENLDLAAGIYFVHVQAGKRRSGYRIFVKRTL